MLKKNMNIYINVIVIISIIIVLLFIIYMKFLTKNSPSVIGENYDKNLTQKMNNQETNIKVQYSFDIDNCYEMRIESYENNSLKKDITVSSSDTILEITDLLKTLPKEGKEYINFLPNTQENIIFYCKDDKKYMISFINKKLKTPSTTFYSEKMESEEKIYNIVMDLLK